MLTKLDWTPPIIVTLSERRPFFVDSVDWPEAIENSIKPNDHLSEADDPFLI